MSEHSVKKDGEYEPEINRTQSFDRAREFQELSAKIEDAKYKRKKGKKSRNEDDLKKEIDMDEHMISLDELCSRLGTDPKRGLTKDQHAKILERDGPNCLTPPNENPWWLELMDQLTGIHIDTSGEKCTCALSNMFTILLWVAAFLCLVSVGLSTGSDDNSNLYLGIILILVVILTGLFSYYQESKSSSVMKGFKKLMPDFAVAIRDGERSTVDATTLVVGDVIEVRAGDKMSADIRVIECNNFKVDNSSLTGESEPQSRGTEMTNENPLETKNVAFYTTLVNEGTATGIVIFTGDHTVIGRIAGLASSSETVETPIRREIKHFIKIIGAVAIILGVIFLVIALFQGQGINAVVFSIGIIVANVPEGLLATVTVSLTLTAKRMASKNVLVKNLESVETLGSTSMICSDKTGTLTQNRMTVAHVYYSDKIFACATDDRGEGNEFDPDDYTFRSLQRCATLCCKAEFDMSDEEENILEKKTIGDASESALIKFCQPLRDILEYRDSNPVIPSAVLPFNSSNKYMVVSVVQEDPNDRRVLVTMKGAPERVFARCTTILIEGEEKEINDHWKQRFQENYEELGGLGERVLGFCQAYLDADRFPPDFAFEADPPNFPCEGLTFLGFCALIDPPRPAVPDAVRLCQSAGIKVVMVTGDHPITAKAIARNVGIIKDDTVDDIAKAEGIPVEDVDPTRANAIVVNGAQLREMSEEDLDRVLQYPQIVFARTSPQQKLLIVEGCQRRKEIVAVTGDGVNDSPALKKADIGVAMGIAGSAVSKEAADMILLDDNFASIVRGVEEGRLIFDNLKKSIAYTLSSNIPELLPFLLFILLGIPIPLPTLLILAVDLGTDMIPAISLAYEKAESDIMKRKPRNAETDKLVNARLIAFAYLQIGIIQALCGMYVYYIVMASDDLGCSFLGLNGASDTFAETKDDEKKKLLHSAQTMYFVSIVMVQWADLLICKTRMLSLFQQGPFGNKVLLFGLVSETILAAIVAYVPFLDIALNTAPPPFWALVLPIPFAIYIFCYDELRKWWMRNHRGGWVENMTYY
eukprot:TRINITY_DN14852_c0_g1_i1.p1 TRINITY_DN14852_c0_g1~~TRINITY_DN14852_c0_g1_i1.p1  ORF type:complete len:1043 (-),score=362.54 TRINITY_DN14852_c0_g1_i1:67-3195(-)